MQQSISAEGFYIQPLSHPVEQHFNDRRSLEIGALLQKGMCSHLVPTSAHSGYGLWKRYFAVRVLYTPVTTASKAHLHPLTSGFCVPAASAGNFNNSVLSETQSLPVSAQAALESHSVSQSERESVVKDPK